MKISIIIPTLNRPADLQTCLEAIARNTRQPDEIIIVEQGDIVKTNEVIRLTGMSARAIFLAEKSLTKARNLGVKETTGDLVVFIDDDVVIADDYLAVAEKYFIDPKNESVLGIVGKDLVYAEKKKNWKDYLRQMIGVIFWRSSFTDRSRVLLSGHNILRNTANTEQVVDWVSGASNCWRRSVFTSFKFDERMIRWCFGEDVSFSHQVLMAHPNCLRYVPSLVYRHNVSMSQRLLNEQIIKMSIIYRYIFWSEQVKNKSFISRFAYVWSQVGFVILEFLKNFSIKEIKIIIKTFIYTFSVGNKKTDSMNDYIVNN